MRMDQARLSPQDIMMRISKEWKNALTGSVGYNKQYKQKAPPTLREDGTFEKDHDSRYLAMGRFLYCFANRELWKHEGEEFAHKLPSSSVAINVGDHKVGYILHGLDTVYQPPSGISVRRGAVS